MGFFDRFGLFFFLGLLAVEVGMVEMVVGVMKEVEMG